MDFFCLAPFALCVIVPVIMMELYKPENLKEFFAAAVKCLDLTHLMFVLGFVLAIITYDEVDAWYNSSSTDKADHDEAKASLAVGQDPRGVGLQATANLDKESRRALKASGNQVAQNSGSCGAHYERIRQRATQICDSQRIIQNQTTALERSEHRADAAERTVRTKDNIIKVQSTFLEIRDSKIEDQRDIIALQAHQIRDSHFELQAMAQQIGEKDQQLWKAAGNLTVAEQEIIKLRATVANESTTSDYCCALDAVHRRDETIWVLEKQLAQQAKDSEFNQETVDSLATLLMTLGDKPPVQAVRELGAWAMEREARFDDFVALSGPVVFAQQDACQTLRNTNDLQHKMLRNALKTRDRQGKTVAEVKAQLVALVVREEHNLKICNQTTGEKQHLLHALNNSQNSLQAAKSELHRRGTGLSALQTELSHHMLQQAIDGQKAKILSNEDSAQKAKLDTLTKQLATMDKQLEASEATRVQEVAMMNNKLCMIREGLKITGLDCDLWTIGSPEQLASMLEEQLDVARDMHMQQVSMMNDKLRMIREALKLTGLDFDLWTIECPNELASMLQHTLSNQDQEAKLAETCAELSATNDRLQTTLTEQDAKIASLTTTNSSLQTSLATQTTALTALQSDLKMTKATHHKAFKDWQSLLSKTTTELKTAKRDSRSRDLENKIIALEIRLKLAHDDNKILAEAKFHAEEKAEILTMAVTDQAERLKGLRERFEMCVKANTNLYEGSKGKGREIEELSERFGEARDAFCGQREEVRRLVGLLECREEEVRELEGVREGLEKKLLLGDEFVEVGEGDVPADAVVEDVDVEEEEVVVQDEEVDCFADEFEEVDADEEENVDCFADEFEFEEVEVIEGVEVDESVDCFADDFEEVEADEDGEGLETLNGEPEVRVQ